MSQHLKVEHDRCLQINHWSKETKYLCTVIKHDWHVQLEVSIMVAFGRKLGGIFYIVLIYFIWIFCIWVHWVWYIIWYVNLCIYVVVQWSVLTVWGEFLTGKQDAFGLDAMYYLIEFLWIKDNDKNITETCSVCLLFLFHISAASPCWNSTTLGIWFCNYPLSTEWINQYTLK